MVKLLITSLSGLFILTPSSLGMSQGHVAATAAGIPAAALIGGNSNQQSKSKAPASAAPRINSATATQVISVRHSQARIQQHIVIRVPRMNRIRRASSAAPLPPIDWVEHRANDCVKTGQLTGSAVVRNGSVDLDLVGGRRVRAKLGNECPAIDFYAGFYVRANNDGKVCAKRDVVRLRSGGECRIRGFHTLIPGR